MAEAAEREVAPAVLESALSCRVGKLGGVKWSRSTPSSSSAPIVSAHPLYAARSSGLPPAAPGGGASASASTLATTVLCAVVQRPGSVSYHSLHVTSAPASASVLTTRAGSHLRSSPKPQVKRALWDLQPGTIRVDDPPYVPINHHTLRTTLHRPVARVSRSFAPHGGSNSAPCSSALARLVSALPYTGKLVSPFHAVVLAALASSKHAAVRRAACNSGLGAVLVLAPPVTPLCALQFCVPP